MADITVTCAHCKNNITISEHVTAETITCMKCKMLVPIPVREPELASGMTKAKLTVAKPPEPPPPPVVTVPVKLSKKEAKAAKKKNVQQYIPQGYKQKKRSRKVSTFEVKVLPWIVFFLLLLVFGWMRYIPGALAPDVFPMFVQGGIWALLLLHFSVICLAFGDDAFSGILCFIIPGYTIYYLFTQADQLLLRGLVAALLIIFGWDFALWGSAVWNDFYTSASDWIATTDTVKKK